MEVVVRHGNVTKAFRVLKKKLQKDGLFRELRLRKFYEKPSEKRARKKKEGIRRVAKEQRLKLKREE
jgi:small subunit ribosomal protein S21